MTPFRDLLDGYCIFNIHFFVYFTQRQSNVITFLEFMSFLLNSIIRLLKARGFLSLYMHNGKEVAK